MARSGGAAFVLEAQDLVYPSRIDTLSAGIGSPARHGYDEHRALPPSGRAIERSPPYGVADFRSE
jgi:hypothetical protein